jgi:hypothetical protein
MQDEEKLVDGLSEFPVLWISQFTEKTKSKVFGEIVTMLCV